jgi:hypothetical protein
MEEKRRQKIREQMTEEEYAAMEKRQLEEHIENERKKRENHSSKVKTEA